MFRNILLGVLSFFISLQVFAANFSKERLARIDKAMQQIIDDQKLSGVVALVLQDGKPIYERAFGMRDKEAGKKMQSDTIFRIASQTKAITSAAALILIEEGKLRLSDPVSRYIPAFAKSKVRDERGNETPAKREVTIRDLLTHGSGIGYGFQSQVHDAFLAKDVALMSPQGKLTLPLIGSKKTTCEVAEDIASLPLVSQPGDAFVYGLSLDVLGCVIERASHMTFDKFLAQRITQPLKMKDTEFFLDESKRDRLATVYNYDTAGRMTRESGQDFFVDGPRKAFSGGGGLLSTAYDYARFLEMIRRGGELDGVRILSPRSVALMTTNQVGSIYRPGMGFGLGFEVVENYGAGNLESKGTFGWAGAFGSVYAVDPKEALTIVFMIQQLPYPKPREYFETFENLLYASADGL